MATGSATGEHPRLSYRGFALRLEGGCTESEARALVDAALDVPGDRPGFVATRADGVTKVYVKAEFRRPDQPLKKRLRPGRAVAEGRGYRFFLAAGLRVPRLVLFGEQPRVLPRACSLIATERVKGQNAHLRFCEDQDPRWPLAAVGALATVHDAGFVHGDAALRNFVPSEREGDGDTYVIDLPKWGEWSAEGVTGDLALLLGTTSKHGGDETLATRLLDAYAAACTRSGELPSDWRDAAHAAAAAYVAHLLERDRTRAERHARKAGSALRPGPRGGDGGSGDGGA